MAGNFIIRSAVLSDAADLAILDDMAGQGLPCWQWARAVAAGEADHAFAYGRARMMRRDVANAFATCRVAESDGVIAGMASSLHMQSSGSVTEQAGPLAPVAALMEIARGTWFVDALAVYPDQRRRRIGACLVADAFERARTESTCTEIGLIVRSDNAPAAALYAGFGFSVVTRRPFVGLAGERAHGREYLLMNAPL